MKEVFLSFQTGDDAVARQVSDFIEQQGWGCWRCTSAMDNIPGTNWMRTLADALLAAKVVMLLYSSRAVGSHHVFREISMAVGADKTILVVCLDDTPFPPEWIYLLRTKQMLNARNQQSTQWIPSLGAVLRVLLKSQCVLPVDSTPDRRIKVRYCKALHSELFGEARVTVFGAVIQLRGLVGSHLNSPQRTIQQLKNLDHALAGQAEVQRTPNPGFCVPFRGTEDILFVTCMLGMDGAERRWKDMLRRLPQLVAEAMGDQNGSEDSNEVLRAEVRLLPEVSWQPADGDGALAAFFADPGQIITPPNPPKRPRVRQRSLLDESGRVLLAQIEGKSRERNAATVVTGNRLPKALTIAAAEAQLGAIIAGR